MELTYGYIESKVYLSETEFIEDSKSPIKIGEDRRIK